MAAPSRVALGRSVAHLVLVTFATAGPRSIAAKVTAKTAAEREDPRFAEALRKAWQQTQAGERGGATNSVIDKSIRTAHPAQ